MNDETKVAYDYSMAAGKGALDIFQSALPTALVFGLVMCLASIVLVIILHRKKLYSRKRKLWNLLAKCHYPVWLLLFASFGFALGMVRAVKAEAMHTIDVKLHPALVELSPKLKKMVIDNLPPELADGPMTGEAIYEYMLKKASADTKPQPTTGSVKVKLTSRIGRKIEGYVRRLVAKAAIDLAIKESAARAGLSEEGAEFSLKTFKSIDFAAASDDIATTVTDSVKKRVDGLARALIVQASICFVVALLLLLVEPLIYYKWWIPRTAKKPPSAKDLALDVE